MKKGKKRDYFVSCIIAAGGKGSRMGADVNKIFLELDDMPILAHTLLAFDACNLIDEMILVTAECDLIDCKNIIENFGIQKVKTIVKGGKERQHSVYHALKEVTPQANIVLVHDAARPLIEEDAIIGVVQGVLEHGAAAVGARCKNTIKQVNADGFIEKTLNRDVLYEIQTPQGFLKDMLVNAYEDAIQNQVLGTDDCFLVERLGFPVRMITGSSDNIKITTYDDLLLAEQILDKRR